MSLKYLYILQESKLVINHQTKQENNPVTLFLLSWTFLKGDCVLQLSLKPYICKGYKSFKQNHRIHRSLYPIILHN